MPHLGTQRAHPIMPEMTVMASDPIGAFQMFSDFCMDLQQRVDALEADVAELKKTIR